MTGKQPTMAPIKPSKAKVLMTQAISLRSRMHGNAHVRFWRRAGEVNFSRLSIELRPTPSQEEGPHHVLPRRRQLVDAALDPRNTSRPRGQGSSAYRLPPEGRMK